MAPLVCATYKWLIQSVEGTMNETVWSMPGGFTSGGGEGYQNVDEERPRPSHHTRPAAPNPSIPAQVGSVSAVSAPAPYQTL